MICTPRYVAVLTYQLEALFSWQSHWNVISPPPESM